MMQMKASRCISEAFYNTKAIRMLQTPGVCRTASVSCTPPCRTPRIRRIIWDQSTPRDDIACSVLSKPHPSDCPRSEGGTGRGGAAEEDEAGGEGRARQPAVAVREAQPVRRVVLQGAHPPPPPRPPPPPISTRAFFDP